MNRMYVRGAAIALVLATGACDDSPTDVGDLSQAEAEALAEVIGATVISGASTAAPGQGAAGGPMAATTEYEETVNFTAECEEGGTVDVDGDFSGAFDDETGDGSFSFTLVQIHDGCVGESGDGTVFTLNGAPSVTSQLDLEVSEQTAAFDGSFNGAVDWATGDREGTCTIDVVFSVDFDGAMETGSANMEGSVCGIEFTKSLSIT